MSRRFGRNQKRRMREALAVEVQRVEETAKLAAQRLGMWHSAMREVRGLESFIETIANRVGRESILARGKIEFEMPHLNRNSFRVLVAPEVLATWRMGRPDMPQMTMAMDTVLHLLDVHAVRDAFRSQIVAECRFDDVFVAAAYSEDFVRKSTEAELAEQISQDMPHFMAREMKKAAK